MAGVLLVCLPIFAVIGLGWLATRARLAPPVMIEAVAAFSFTFALPALMLRLMAEQPIARIFDPRFFAGYLACCLIVFAVAMAAAARLGGRPRAPAAGIGAAASFGNVGYLGPPLLLPLLGEAASGPLALAIMAEVVVVLLLGDVLMTRPGDAADGPGPLGRAARAIGRNPVVLAILLGAALGATGAVPPEAVDRFLAFLGNAAGPTALFALGGTLGRLRFRRRLLSLAAAISAAKLGLYPLLAWAMLGPVLALPPAWVAGGTLMAAMPIASNAYALAQRHGAAVQEVSAAVLLSTIAAVATFPLTAWLVLRPAAP